MRDYSQRLDPSGNPYGSGGGSSALSESEPAAPVTGVALWSRVMAGREMVGWKDVDGENGLCQPHLLRNRVSVLLPSAGAATFQGLGFPATTGTGTARTPASTNLFTMARRAGFVTAATAGASQGIRSNVAEFLRGTTFGGFHFITRFGISHAAAVAQARAFVGLAPAAAFSNANPSTFLNQIGLQFDSAETTWRIGSNDGTGVATRTDLGANYPATTLSTDWYELQLFCKRGDTKIEYRVDRLSTTGQSPATGTITTDLPASSQLLAPQIWINNGTTALAAAIDFGGFYIESDD